MFGSARSAFVSHMLDEIRASLLSVLLDEFEDKDLQCLTRISSFLDSWTASNVNKRIMSPTFKQCLSLCAVAFSY